ncbi:MAG: hypothetical protein AAB575_01100 [Patescibacteria group bacterium]
MAGTWDKIKTAATETGEKLIGRGPEVKFRHEAQEYADTKGVSIEAAQKSIMGSYFDALNRKRAVSGAIDYESKEWRAISAAVNETMGADGIEELKKTADNPAYPCPAMALSTAEFRRVYSSQENYYKRKFESKAPVYAVLSDCANNAAMFDRYGRDVEGFIKEACGNSIPAEALFAANPTLKAEFGKMFQLKELLEKHEDRFRKDQNFDKTLMSSEEAVTKALGDSLKGMFDSTINIVKACGMMFSGQFGAGLMRGVTETAKLLGHGVAGVGSLGYHMTKVVGSKLKNI